MTGLNPDMVNEKCIKIPLSKRTLKIGIALIFLIGFILFHLPTPLRTLSVTERDQDLYVVWDDKHAARVWLDLKCSGVRQVCELRAYRSYGFLYWIPPWRHQKTIPKPPKGYHVIEMFPERNPSVNDPIVTEIQGLDSES